MLRKLTLYTLHNLVVPPLSTQQLFIQIMEHGSKYENYDVDTWKMFFYKSISIK